MLLLDVDNIDCINMKLLEQIKYDEASNEEEKHRIDMVKELIEAKRKQLQLENFSVTEIDQMLEIFCNFFKKNADTIILVYFLNFFKDFLSGTNHMNLCTKYNVNIMF